MNPSFISENTNQLNARTIKSIESRSDFDSTDSSFHFSYILWPAVVLILFALFFVRYGNGGFLLKLGLVVATIAVCVGLFNALSPLEKLIIIAAFVLMIPNFLSAI